MTSPWLKYIATGILMCDCLYDGMIEIFYFIPNEPRHQAWHVSMHTKRDIFHCPLQNLNYKNPLLNPLQNLQKS